MKTTIDSAGRIVIPKKLRDQAGLTPGMELEVSCRYGRIEVEPAEVEYHIERRGRFLVAVPDREVPPLTNEMVTAAIKQLREERMAEILNPQVADD